MEARRINVNKNDEIAFLAEKVIDLKTKDIILTVPRFSNLAQNEANFSLLKREAEAIGKTIAIETVDEEVIRVCKKYGIDCSNPIFEAAKKKFSDIKTSNKRKSSFLEKNDLEESETENTEDLHIVKAKKEVEEIYQPPGKKIRSRRFGRKPLIFSISAVAIILGFFITFGVLPRAEIKVIASKIDWAFKKEIFADTSIKMPDFEKALIPGQIFIQNKNLQMSFLASGKGFIENKASGEITVFNAYNSSPQILVATTRFETPDGKIFRLKKQVTVPGAKVSNGKLEPSFVSAEVIADKPGEAYNIVPVRRFTIPGFAGTPRFEAFYASSDANMTGGVVGDSSFATDADVAGAEKEIEVALKESIRTFMLAQLPNDLKFLPEAENFKIVKKTVNRNVNSDGKFSILLHGEMKITVFREQDLSFLVGNALESEVGEGYEVRDFNLDYGNIVFVSDDKISFEVDYSAKLAKKVDSEALKQKIAGKSESDLKALLFSVSGLDGAQISLWPFWVGKIPEQEDKITIVVD